MSKTYYVDSENVGDSCIDLMEEDESSHFHVFYTEHSPRIDYKHMLTIMNAKRKPESLQCAEGNNALDFQLVSYLGYQLRSKKMLKYLVSAEARSIPSSTVSVLLMLLSYTRYLYNALLSQN
ncbi:MAG: hypothetical protein K6E47_09900 [Lachnospiraceae bacterium]|nr:hypothetical protein [Lachnospiraceae bacterium]